MLSNIPRPASSVPLPMSPTSNSTTPLGPAPAPPPRRFHPQINENEGKSSSSKAATLAAGKTRIPLRKQGVPTLTTASANSKGVIDGAITSFEGLALGDSPTKLSSPPSNKSYLIPPAKPVRTHLPPAAESSAPSPSPQSKGEPKSSLITHSTRDVYQNRHHDRQRDKDAMSSTRGTVGSKREEKFVASSATRRKCEMTNVYFLDYYFDLLNYLDQRRTRLNRFKDDMATSDLPPQEQSRQWTYLCGKERAHLRKRRTRLRLANFSIITQVGQGGYGQVFLAKKNDTKEVCALKKMSKGLLHKLGEIQHILTERDILTRTDSPWLVKLLYAFQDYDNVYLAMEYVPGGDMRTLLNNSGVLKEPHAQFYVAEMCLAVSELHRLGYIHRDLKPENFLVDAGGHLKLTDFGLSRGELSQGIVDSLRVRLDKVKSTPLNHLSIPQRRSIHKSIRREDMQAFSLVGSPDYMAPEVLTNHKNGYGLAVDYWSIGCILFECLSGYPPFTAPTTDDVWVNVYHWERVLERPTYTGADEEFNLSDAAWSLITSLITNASSRLSNLDQVSSHPFFASYDLGALRSEGSKIVPPFVPHLATATDTTYFDDFEDPKDMAMYKEVQERMREMERKGGVVDGEGAGLRKEFVGFTFKHKEAVGWGGEDEYTGSTMF
ncbi:serine/threonine protein kinase, AGC family [Phlyctochytrium arcticum]|nr:serine/threonine protein kinase, AGC family [Phlyctochytrium arcticum]